MTGREAETSLCFTNYKRRYESNEVVVGDLVFSGRGLGAYSRRCARGGAMTCCVAALTLCFAFQSSGEETSIPERTPAITGAEPASCPEELAGKKRRLTALQQTLDDATTKMLACQSAQQKLELERDEAKDKAERLENKYLFGKKPEKLAYNPDELAELKSSLEAAQKKFEDQMSAIERRSKGQSE
jgi:hypothetical protein